MRSNSFLLSGRFFIPVGPEHRVNMARTLSPVPLPAASFRLCRMETLHELMAVLDTCTEAQRRRFLLYALEGLSLAEIGVLCGCSKVAVYQSVEAVRKKFINFFENRLNE